MCMVQPLWCIDFKSVLAKLINQFARCKPILEEHTVHDSRKHSVENLGFLEKPTIYQESTQIQQGNALFVLRYGSNSYLHCLRTQHLHETWEART